MREDKGSGYRTVETMSATGFNVEIKKLPMSVTVVNRQLIDDIAPSLIVDALVTVPGVTKSGLPIDVPANQFFIRGFGPPLKQDSVLVNQMEGTVDSFNLAKIEIIRGPSAIFNPSGSAGGSVQLVTKSPLEKNGDVIRGELGDFYGNRVDFDYNLVVPVPSWKEDRIFFRIVASKQDADTMEENGHIKMESIAPSLKIKLGARADLVLRYQHLGIDDSVAQGQPYYYENGGVGFIPGVPRERSVFLPGTNTHAINSTFAADLTFAVTDWLNGAIKYRDMHTETARFHSRPNNEPTTVLPNGDVPSRFFSFNKGLDTKFLSIDFASEFDLGPTHHQALAGVELLHNGPVRWMDEFNFPAGNPLVFNIYRSPENLPIPPKTGSAIPGPFGDSRTTAAKLIENMSILDRTLSFTVGVVSHYQEDALAPGNAGTNTVVQWGVLYDTPLDRITNGRANRGSGFGAWGQLIRLSSARSGCLIQAATLRLTSCIFPMCRFCASQRLVTVVRAFSPAAIASFQSTDLPVTSKSATAWPSRRNSRSRVSSHNASRAACTSFASRGPCPRSSLCSCTTIRAKSLLPMIQPRDIASNRCCLRAGSSSPNQARYLRYFRLAGALSGNAPACISAGSG